MWKLESEATIPLVDKFFIVEADSNFHKLFAENFASKMFVFENDTLSSRKMLRIYNIGSSATY